MAAGAADPGRDRIAAANRCILAPLAVSSRGHGGRGREHNHDDGHDWAKLLPAAARTSPPQVFESRSKGAKCGV